MMHELMNLQENESFVVCPSCDVKFEKPKYSTSTRVYCSVPCKIVGTRVERVKFTCPTCMIVFERIPSQAQGSKFCSRECKQKESKNLGMQTIKNCECCGKEIDFLKTYYRKTVKYCSRECNSRMMKRKKKKVIA